MGFYAHHKIEIIKTILLRSTNIWMKEKIKQQLEKLMQTDKESSLIRRIQRCGDRQAAEELISIHYREIYAFVFRQTGDMETAMDVTQEVFLAVLQSIHRYDPKQAGFRTWMYRIASHKLTDVFRSAEYRFCRDAVPLDGLSLPEDADLEERWLEAEQLGAIQKWITEQQDDAQNILRLRFYGEKNFREIAEILKLPEGTVKTKYYTAIRFLRKEAREP